MGRTSARRTTVALRFLPLFLFLFAALTGAACTGHPDELLGEARLASGNPPPGPSPSPSPSPDPVCPTAGADFPADLATDPPAEVGTIAGSFSVTPSGDARYSMPLVPLPGRAGMQPQLSLVYGGSGDGSQGFGFSLAGLSRVMRCSKNQAQDGIIAPIAYDDTDALCIDGRRLVVIGQSSGVTEFRTIPDSFAKVLGFFPAGWNPKRGPASLRAFTKEGVVIDYGSTGDSQALAANGAIRAWWAARSTDRSGNFIDFRYINDKNTDDPTHPFTTELLPDRILYTGHPSAPPTRSVMFAYVPRQTGLVRTTFAGGMKLVTSRMLTTVEMRGPSNKVFRKYELGYIESATTGRPLLADVKECTEAGVCKPPTRFAWNTPKLGFEDVPTPLPLPVFDAASVITTDLDGNGLDDLVVAEGESLAPATHFLSAMNLGPKAGHFPAKYAEAYFEDFNTYPTPLLERGTPLDYDHDGRIDLFLHDVNGNATTWKLLHAKADGTFERQDTGITRPFVGLGVPGGLKGPDASAHLADMDGDGMVDLVSCTKAAVGYTWTLRPWRPGGPGFAAAETMAPLEIQPCDSELYTVDVDGDSKAELMVPDVILALDGTTQYLSEYVTVTRRLAGDYAATDTKLEVAPKTGGMFFLDVNGDGLADAVQTGFTDKQPWTFLNTGKGFLPKRSGLPGNVLPADDFASIGTAIDFDVDGLQDLLIPMSRLPGNLPSWTVLRSRGDGTFDIVDLPSFPFDSVLTQAGITLAFPHGPRVFEANGDGANDVLLPAGATFHVFRNKAAHADALASITDGMAPYDPGHPSFRPSVAIHYSTLVDPNVYERGEDCEYPIRCVIGPRRVVDSYEVDKGGKKPRHFEMRYRDGRFHRLGRGFLGFGERTVLDVDKHAGRVEVYDNKTFNPDFSSFPFAGQPASILRWNATISPTNGVTVEFGFSSMMYLVTPTNGGASHFTVPYYRRERREQGAMTFLEFAAGHAGKLERYTRDAFVGAENTARVSESIHSLLEVDDFGNALAEKTLVGRELDIFAGALEAQADTVEEVKRTFKNDPAKWQIGLPETQNHCSTASGQTLCRSLSRSYDAKGRLKASTVETPGDAETWVQVTFSRDAFGNITKTVAEDAFDGRRASCTAYDPNGIFPYSSRNPEGHLAYTKFHEGFGVPLAEIDPDKRVTLWAIDGFGRVTLQKRPDGTETIVEIARGKDGGPLHDEYVTRVHTTTPGWSDEIIDLDRLGRSIRQSSRGYTVQGVPTPRMLRETTFDELGDDVERVLVPTWETTPAAQRLYEVFERDGLGRVTKYTAPWGGVSTTSYWENKVYGEDARHGITMTELNGFGRPVRIRDAEGGETTYSYGPFGGRLSVTDPGGAVATTERDAFGQVRVAKDADRGETITRYSGFGEARSTKDALGREVLFYRDGLGRVELRKDADGDTRWIWDTAAHGTGQVAEVRSPAGFTKKWSYDGAGRPIATELDIDGDAFSMGYGYDAQSRLSSITYPEANGIPFVVQNDYDSAAHLVGVREAGNPIPTWQITATDRGGRIIGERFGNGVETTQGYDEGRDRIASIVTNGAKALQDLSFTFDAVRNVDTRSDHLQARVEAFEYDALQRLHCASFDGEAPCARGWKYAPDGNLLASPDAGAYTYELGRPHVLESTQIGAYAHDAVGNQIERPDAVVEYTAFDLPKYIGWKDGSKSLFDYGGDGQRIRKRTGDLVSVYVDELYERVTNTLTGDVEHRYHVRSSERTVAIVTRSAAGTARRWLHVDHLGSIDAVSNEAGQLAERRSYEPFGGRRNPVWGAPAPQGPFSSATTIGFTGHIGDEELGLVLMRGRVYDPKVGRFLTPDPVVANVYSGQSWNGFSYVVNNPLRFTDSSGFEPDVPRSPGEQNARDVPVLPCCDITVVGEEEEPAELGALRSSVDFGSWGNTTAFRDAPPAPGSERETKDGWDIATSLFGGFVTEYGFTMEDVAIQGVLSVALPQYYGLYRGIVFWTGVIDAADAGDKYDGERGAVISVINAVNPLAHAGEAAAGLVVGVENGDYAAAGARGFDLARIVVELAVGGVLGAERGAGGVAGGAAKIRNADLAGNAHPKTGVPFDHHGYPDFSSYRHPNVPDVRIELSGSRSTDFARANAAAGLKETPPGYTWHHHQDKGLMQLVDRKVHGATGHTGGYTGQ